MTDTWGENTPWDETTDLMKLCGQTMNEVMNFQSWALLRLCDPMSTSVMSWTETFMSYQQVFGTILVPRWLYWAWVYGTRKNRGHQQYMFNQYFSLLFYYVIQMCSGITCDRVLNREFYAQRFQKLIYLHLFTDWFMKTSPKSSEQIQLLIRHVDGWE